MPAEECLARLLREDFDTVLDVGCGNGAHAREFERAGKKVTTIAYTGEADIIGDYLTTDFKSRFDCLWLSHVLEHQKNVGLFLQKCFSDLNKGGILAVTVPPMKQQIVGGHLTCWNAGLLLYNMILAGFDCSEAKVKTYGYNVSVIVRKKQVPEKVLASLVWDCGDIERLSRFFPFEAKQDFNGNIQQVNW
jgi:SAM-dependent methyltransferase